MAAADSIRQCAFCGTDLPPQNRPSGMPRKFCSSLCRYRESHKAKLSRWANSAELCSISGCTRAPRVKGLCGLHYGRERRLGSALADPPKTRRIEKPCAWCGEVMRLKPSIARQQTFCSTSCAQSSRKTGRRDKLVCCPGCGTASTRVVRSCRDAGKYCSRECYSARSKRIQAERNALKAIAENWRPKPNPAVANEIRALRRIARYVERPRKTIRPCTHCRMPTVGRMEYARTCAKCAAERRRAYGKSAPAKSCKRIYKARRRAIERGADADRIDPIKVFERDKWRCHLCGCKTPRRLRGTYEPDAPELDHVIPLAAGGSHTWGNVKCACRRCNGDKGAEPRGQLGLEMAA